MLARLLLAVALLAAAPARAQPAVVTSPTPDRVSLTVYRAPYGRGAIDLRYLGGFAMVTEVRRVRLPRGPATLRFEGVAEGIVPVSAVIEGLPGGTIEKNRDTRLLSPASLVDGTLGRQVTLTRTDRATGKKTSETATIVAGPRPGVVLRTAAGIEALRCSGLAEKLAFPEVPAGLSAKPVLSVATDSPSARTVTVRLTYLSSGFDWRATYVATLVPGAATLDLFAWLTLANGNPETFARAEVLAVAGRLNRTATPVIPAEAAALSLSCYPLGTTTSDLPSETFEEADEIIVTGSRVPPPPPAPVAMFAPSAPPAPPPPPEDLGDLKLYRVPARADVAPRAQKQVALLAQDGVRFERRYRRAVSPGQRLEAAPTAIVLRIRNDAADGLGIALPAGSTALYGMRGGDRLLLGLGQLSDRAKGETFRLAAGVSRQVLVAQVPATGGKSILTATNATAAAVRLDVPIGTAGQKITAGGAAVERVDGVATWSPTIPAGGTAELRYQAF